MTIPRKGVVIFCFPRPRREVNNMTETTEQVLLQRAYHVRRDTTITVMVDASVPEDQAEQKAQEAAEGRKVRGTAIAHVDEKFVSVERDEDDDVYEGSDKLEFFM
jgi:hypothetical protein